MFKCNINASHQTFDETVFRLYQFFFLSILLYRDLWKNVTCGYNDKVEYNFEQVKWSKILGLPELEQLTPDEIKKDEKSSGQSGQDLFAFNEKIPSVRRKPSPCP